MRSKVSPGPALAAIALTVALASVGILGDLAFRERAAEMARAEALGQAESMSRALSAAIGRRSALVEGLRAWLVTDAGRRLEGFEAFSTALVPTVEDVRAVQVVENGTIIRTWPPGEAGPLLGYDLLSHPDPRIRRDVERAVRSDSLIVTPVADLLQGGQGATVRRRVPGSDPVRVATVVLDLAPVLTEAGIDPAAGHTLRSPEGRVLAGSAPADDPPWGGSPGGGPNSIDVPVLVGGEEWWLTLAGSAGSGSPPPILRIAEALGLLTVLLAGILTYLGLDRRRRLEGAVRLRTAQLDRAIRDLGAANASLRAQDDRLAMALEAGGVTTWEWDLERDEVRHFPGSMDGVETNPETGAARFRDVAATVHAEDRTRFDEAERRTRAEGEDFDVEYRVVLPDGAVRWRRDHGRVVAEARVRGAVVDVTRAKELEEQLAHSRKLEAIGQLAGGIAHDFNNLMQVILGHAALLRTDRSDAELDEGLDEITRAAEHASSLTGQLLAFSRRRPVRPEPLDLVTEVRASLGMLRRLLGSGVRIEERHADEAAVVLIDPAQLTQILVNLSVNARDAMPWGGCLTLRTGRVVVEAGGPGPVEPGSYGLLEVHDEGEGIPAQIVEHIFDPFFTTKEPGKGTGLGLASVYGAVRQAGGDVTVTSEPGDGSLFRVLLPLAPDA